MTKTLYVGNLPWKTSEAELTSAFEAHIPVISTRIITETETGRSKGFGFIEVEDNDLEKAIKEMHGLQFAGRNLIVSEAKPKTSKSRFQE